MSSLASLLNLDSDVLVPGSEVLRLCEVASTGVSSPMREARVAVALREPLALVRALLALDGQVAAILLLSGQASADIVRELVEGETCTHLLTDREDLLSDECAVTEVDLMGRHLEDSPVPTSWLMTTSGTTGSPKVIPHSLRSLSRTTVTLTSKPTWGMLYDGTRFAGMQLILQSLIGGGRLVLVDTYEPLAQQVADMVAAGVTHLSATPTLWRRILMVPGHSELKLAQVTLGGEIADQSVLTALSAAFPRARVTHIYASTETGVGFAVNDGKAGFPEMFLAAAPGGVKIKVDDNGMWVRPPSYLGSVAPAKSVLCDDEGFLFTGDQVERRGGRVYFLGRCSGVINIGGVKVHPERVEAVIAGVDGVGLVQVTSKTNPFTGSLVVATVQAQKGQNLDRLRASILETCRSTLEREAVPAFVKFASDLEVNAAGKIVRKQGVKS